MKCIDFFRYGKQDIRPFQDVGLHFSFKKMLIINDMYKDVTGNDLLHSIDYAEWKTIKRLFGKDIIESHWRYLIGVFAETMEKSGISY